MVLYEERHRTGEVWEEFWRKYKILNPHFSFFIEEDEGQRKDYSRTIAFYLHGDEGRTLKKGGLMTTSLQSVLGTGFADKRLKAPKDTTSLQCNYSGHTFCMRFVVSVIPKTAYESNAAFFEKAMDAVVQSLGALLRDGLTHPLTGERFFFVVLGVKGDLPYLQKLGKLNRSWNTTSKKRSRGGRLAGGTCHLCLAGTAGCHAEEIVDHPQWEVTIGVRQPWLRTPFIVQHLCHNLSNPASFFKHDLWHSVHLGLGKSFVCSCLQIALEVVPATNNEDRFRWLTNHYRAWCKDTSSQPHVTKITPSLISYGEKTGAAGAWRKGALTTNLMRWIVVLVSALSSDKGGYLSLCATAAVNLNEFFSCLHNAPLFLSGNEATYLAGKGMTFLKIYARLALDLFREGRPHLFALYPKIHVIHHFLWDMRQEAGDHNLSLHPLSAACQMDEDLVGRVSRLSRRVNIRAVIQRTLERYLIGCYAAWREAGLI